jgi:D-alanyl-D-alanine carboxypeptidase/D-alanyl-D-alanine-endopeptidase (penicillin-binding protein 4)
VASLAVAGTSGTIARRFASGPAEQRLRAKTGSLRGVSALSGYVVTRDDRILAFSVMMNDYPGRAREMWQVQDQIGEALADFKATEVVARE